MRIVEDQISSVRQFGALLGFAMLAGGIGVGAWFLSVANKLLFHPADIPLLELFASVGDNALGVEIAEGGQAATAHISSGGLSLIVLGFFLVALGSIVGALISGGVKLFGAATGILPTSKSGDQQRPCASTKTCRRGVGVRGKRGETCRCSTGLYMAMGLACVVFSAIPAAAQQTENGLFPPLEPFRTGYLNVDEPHELYYELSGNPDGKPVICLHGGPGAGSYPRLRQYSIPRNSLIVLYDQRGAGQSRPYGELKGNNQTWHLVADLEQLRAHLEIERFLLFGGSWGTTLGLAYAEAHPQRVTGMILRGVFLGTEEEVLSHYIGARYFFPQEHARLLAALPDQSRGTHPDYLHELIRGEDRELAYTVMYALGRFELKYMKLYLPDATVSNILASEPPDKHHLYVSLDLHYVVNRYFLEPGQLLRDVERIAHIPTVIINGRYDMACPPVFAYRLHEALPKSELIIVERAGHSETEEGTTRELVKAAAGFE